MARRQPPDEVAVYRAIRGERLPLTISERRLAVQQLTSAQLSAAEIAHRLGLSTRSVVRHRSQIRRGNCPRLELAA